MARVNLVNWTFGCPLDVGLACREIHFDFIIPIFPLLIFSSHIFIYVERNKKLNKWLKYNMCLKSWWSIERTAQGQLHPDP